MSDDPSVKKGVRLELQKVEEVNAAGGKRARIEFLARIHDDETWAVVQKKIEHGLTIYTAGDFSSAMNDALAEENQRLERRLAVVEAELREERTRTTALTAKNNEMSSALGVLGRELG